MIMTTADIKRLGLILAIQAEIEGMKAWNKMCEIGGGDQLYNEESFFKKADELRNIVNKHDDQL